MNGDNKKSDKKTLLPELLPGPRPEAGQPPRERVAVRARAMLDRLAGLKTSAGAALLAAHCGYGVVDPLPPPPSQCTASADPFANFHASGSPFNEDGGAVAFFQLANYGSIGYQLTAVRVTAGGTLDSIDDLSRSGGGGETDFAIRILPDGSGAPIQFEVDLGCGAAATTKKYRATPNGYGYTVVEQG